MTSKSLKTRGIISQNFLLNFSPIWPMKRRYRGEISLVPGNNKPNILIEETQEDFFNIEDIQDSEYQVYRASSDEEIFYLTKVTPFTVVVLLRTPTLEFVQKLAENSMSTAAIVCILNKLDGIKTQFFDWGVHDCIVRPASSQLIKSKIKLLIKMKLQTDLIHDKNSTLYKAHKQLQIIGQINNLGIFETNHQGICLHANQQYCSILEKNQEQCVTQEWYQNIISKDKERLLSDWEKSTFQGRPLNIEYQIKTESGTKKWIKASIVAHLNNRNQIQSFTGTISDISTKKRSELKIFKMKKNAERATIAKTNFLANMSHEIRTPLTAIVGMTDVLMDTQLTEEQVEFVETLRNAGANLLDIVTSILDLSKIDAGELTLEIHKFELEQMLSEIADIYGQLAQKKKLALIFDVPYHEENIFEGDSARLRQILTGLISNSIKFSEKGEIILKISKEGENTVFQIIDQGLGIPPKKLKSIFETFNQADTSLTRKYGGTGLGLTVAYKLVKLMKGTINVESQEGLGSTFTIKVPLIRINEKSKYFKESYANLNALIIDDNKTEVSLLSGILGAAKITTVMAKGGEEGIEIFKKNSKFDLIFIDIRMSPLGGIETFKELQKIKKIAHKTILMMMPLKRKSDTQKINELKIAKCLTKPLHKKNVFSSIDNILDKKDPKDDKSDVEGPGLSILVVDDSPDNRALVKLFLKKTSHKITLRFDGQEGVDAFCEDDFDVVLMDMQMPRMDGMTATRLIRKWEEENKKHPTPIIAFTAHAYKEEKLAAFDAGCNDHLAKPFRKDTLLKALSQYQGKKPKAA